MCEEREREGERKGEGERERERERKREKKGIKIVQNSHCCFITWCFLITLYKSTTSDHMSQTMKVAIVSSSRKRGYVQCVFGRGLRWITQPTYTCGKNSDRQSQ